MITINNDLSPNKCPLCQSDNISELGQIFYSEPTYYSSIKVKLLKNPELWRCKNCNSRFTKNIIRDHDSIKLYSEGDASERWETTSSFEEEKTREVVEALSSLLKPGDRILDIGCNTGDLLDFARKFNCKTFGLEYSQSSLNIVREKGHIAFSSIEDIQDRLDLIVAFDLIEHLYDVPKFLAECYKLLDERGRLVLFTGNIDSLPSKILASNWWYVTFPEHIVFPSRSYFQNCSRFKIIKWIKTHHSSSFKISFLLRFKRLVLTVFRSLVLKKSSNGFPPFEPDHVLVVLERL